jgi:hypothetical protein
VREMRISEAIATMVMPIIPAKKPSGMTVKERTGRLMLARLRVTFAPLVELLHLARFVEDVLNVPLGTLYPTVPPKKLRKGETDIIDAAALEDLP